MTATWARMEPLDESESMRMLGSVRWGRCAWAGPEGPRILPVNLSVLDGNVFFRTALYGSLADAAHGDAVAVEADELDDRLSSGWSVVVLGRAERVEDPGRGRVGVPPHRSTVGARVTTRVGAHPSL